MVIVAGPTGMVPLRQQTVRAVAAYEGDTRIEGFFEKGEGR